MQAEPLRVWIDAGPFSFESTGQQQWQFGLRACVAGRFSLVVSQVLVHKCHSSRAYNIYKYKYNFGCVTPIPPHYVCVQLPPSTKSSTRTCAAPYLTSGPSCAARAYHRYEELSPPNQCSHSIQLAPIVMLSAGQGGGGRWRGVRV